MVVYLDDILVYSKTEFDHIQHLKQVITTPRSQKLYRKLEKYEFLVPRVIFLSYMVSYDGIQVNEAKVEAIKS